MNVGAPEITSPKLVLLGQKPDQLQGIFLHRHFVGAPGIPFGPGIFRPRKIPSIPDGSRAVGFLASSSLRSVGAPGIEPGLRAPHARVLPIYYAPIRHHLWYHETGQKKRRRRIATPLCLCPTRESDRAAFPDPYQKPGYAFRSRPRPASTSHRVGQGVLSARAMS